jgi:membrane associated rhomboid family serine protease
MYLRLGLWTVLLAYTAFLFARANGSSPLSVMFTAAFLGAIMGFGLGSVFVNRAARKQSHLSELLRNF